MNILIIEPDILLAKTYKHYLEENGNTVRTCETVQRALNLVDEKTPELIILEIQIAAHNGIEFFYEFRSFVDWDKIPVLINSLIPKHRLGLNSQNTIDLGVVDYLYKPQTTLSRLLYTIENCLVISS
jgi:two-component system OmpR family response regulator